MDTFGRTIDYLRISVTDRCNERCLYCMPENYRPWTRRGDHLSADEIVRIAATATDAERGVYVCRHCRLVVESIQLPEFKCGEIWGGVKITVAAATGKRPPCARNPIGVSNAR